jgi:hypothetical protein
MEFAIQSKIKTKAKIDAPFMGDGDEGELSAQTMDEIDYFFKGSAEDESMNLAGYNIDRFRQGESFNEVDVLNYSFSGEYFLMD